MLGSRSRTLLVLVLAFAVASSGLAQSKTQTVDELVQLELEIQKELAQLRADLAKSALPENDKLQFEKRLKALELAQRVLSLRIGELAGPTAAGNEPAARVDSQTSDDPSAVQANSTDDSHVPAETTSRSSQPTDEVSTGAPISNPGLTPLDVTGQVTSGTAFNPAISVIPDGVFYTDNRDGEAGEFIGAMDGFATGATEEPGHSQGEQSRGFSIRETELSFSAAVDPYFDVAAIFAVGTDGIETEEVFARTRSLPAGLQLKFGRFFSGIGYINSQHPHQWDFVNQNLLYEAMFGGNLAETGVQLTWLPAFPVYTLFGVEALQGDNERISRFEGPTADAAFEPTSGPRLWTAFVKMAPEIGYSHALQGGLFGGRSRAHQEEREDRFLAGNTWFLGTDWVYKYDSPKQFGQGDVTLQGEYVYRAKNLRRLAEDPLGGFPGDPERSRQDGFYVQGIYGFAPRLTFGGRFDAVGLTNRIETPLDSFDLSDSRRWAVNLTFNPTEFSRLRLQFDRGSASIGGMRETFSQLFAQFQLSLGVHGAHKF